MGHYASEMNYYPSRSDKRCQWKHPHHPHDWSEKWVPKYCPGYKVKSARDYHVVQVVGLRLWECPDCSSLIRDREIHDKFHEGCL